MSRSSGQPRWIAECVVASAGREEGRWSLCGSFASSPKVRTRRWSGSRDRTMVHTRQIAFSSSPAATRLSTSSLADVRSLLRRSLSCPSLTGRVLQQATSASTTTGPDGGQGRGAASVGRTDNWSEGMIRRRGACESRSISSVTAAADSPSTADVAMSPLWAM